MERDTHLQGIFTSLLINLFTYVSGSPVKDISLQVPLMLSPWREMSRSYSSHSFIIYSPRHTSPLPDSSFSSDLNGVLWREKPLSRTFLNIYSSVISKGALARSPPYWAPSERNSQFLEPPPISRNPWYMSPIPGSPTGLYGKRYPSTEPLLPILQGPQEGSTPSCFPSQSSHRETPDLHSPFQPSFKVPARRTSLPRSPNEAPIWRTPVPEPSSKHKPPSYEPSPRFPSDAPIERGAHLQSLLLHL